MDGDHGDAIGGEPCGQFRGHRHLRQLALPIGADHGAWLLEVDVVEVDRICRQRGDVDDPRRRRSLERGSQSMDQYPAGEVVDRPVRFVAIGAGFARVIVGEADAGIVHQQVELGMVPGDCIGEGAHGVERRKIGADEGGRSDSGRVDFVNQRLAALGIASMRDDLRAFRRQRAVLPR
jgi:hypothetical protein